MRRTKEQTVEFYKSEYLSNRDDNFIKKFEQKTPEQQYIAIMNWRRYQRVTASKDSEENKASFSSFIKFLKNAETEILNLTTLSPKEAEKACELLDNIKTNVINFDKIQKQKLIDELIKQEENLQKESDSLKQKIADLKKEIE